MKGNWLLRLIVFFLSIYVLNVFAQFSGIEEDQYAIPVKGLKPGIPGREAGEIITPFNDAQIAAWCDFTKQIVVTRTGVLCAYVGNKGPIVPNIPGSPAPPKPSPPRSPGMNAN